MNSSTKPSLLFCSMPLSGHILPVLSLVHGLTERGYDVTVVTGTAFEEKVKAVGADFVPLKGNADYNDDILDEIVPGRKEMAPSFDRTVLDVEHIMVGPIPEQFEAVQRAFQKLSESGRPVVLVSEVLFFGAHVISLGAPGFKPAGWVCLGVLPLLLRSSHTLGLDFDQGAEAAAKKQAFNLALEHHVLAKASAKHKAICKELGATEEPKFIWEHGYLHADKFLQLCPPSLEFPRPDLPETVQFAGATPAHRHNIFTPPEWWDDVKKAKRVVVVTQGTFAVDYSNLIVPTLEGLRDEPETLVVAILGRKGAKLPENVDVPPNAHVIDYLYYDAILPYSDVMVYNGGYGGLQHSLSHSVPVIIAGDSEDKPMVAARAEAAGVALDLKTGRPSAEQVKQAIDSVLANNSYHEASKKVQKDLEQHNSLDILEQTVLALGRRDFGLTTKSDENLSESLAVEEQQPSVTVATF